MNFYRITPSPLVTLAVTMQGNSEHETLDRFASLYLNRKSYMAAADDGLIPPELTIVQVNDGPETDHETFLEEFETAIAATIAAALQNSVPIIDGTPDGRIVGAAENDMDATPVILDPDGVLFGEDGDDDGDENDGDENDTRIGKL